MTTPAVPHLSLAASMEQEAAASILLSGELHSQNLYESQEITDRREEALVLVRTLLKAFVEQPHPTLSRQASRITASSKLIVFGSYRLGVHGPDSDLDTLCAVSRHVTREYIFDRFPSFLKAVEGVEDVLPVPGARVPIITATVLGISMDLCFATLNLDHIPADLDITDDGLLVGLEEKCMLSLNGPRNIEAILRWVPDVVVFSEVLRAVRYWAKGLGIYSNSIGFLGGIGWAIAVAETCHANPNFNSAATLRQFFYVMTEWRWPKALWLHPPELGGDFDELVWDSVYNHSDKKHVMPILTPAYPSACSSYGVVPSTLGLMKEKFRSALGATDKIIMDRVAWKTLFVKQTFFKDYTKYLRVCAITTCDGDHSAWSATVENKLRLLVKHLDTVEDLDMACPFPLAYKSSVYCLDQKEVASVKDGSVSLAVLRRTEKEVQIKPHQRLSQNALFIGLRVRPRNAIGRPRSLSFAPSIKHFEDELRKWEGYDGGKMYLAVTVLNRSDVPDFLRGIAKVTVDWDIEDTES